MGEKSASVREERKKPNSFSYFLFTLNVQFCGFYLHDKNMILDRTEESALSWSYSLIGQILTLNLNNGRRGTVIYYLVNSVSFQVKRDSQERMGRKSSRITSWKVSEMINKSPSS